MSSYDQLAALLAPPKVAMRIDSPCITVDQFVASYHAFCAPTSCFVPSSDVRAIGEHAAFVVRLADGTAVLRGICTVLGAWLGAQNPFGRPGMHIGLVELSPESRGVYDRLLVAAGRTAASSAKQTAHERDIIAAMMGMPPLPRRAATERTAPLVIPPKEPQR